MSRKPKDIWGIPFPDANDVVEFMNRAVRTGRVASGDREALPATADSYLNVREVGKTISQVNDLANPFSNTTKQLLGIASGNPGAEAKFAKSLAGDVAITGAGFGVGKVVGAGVKAAAPRIAGALAKANLTSELAPGQSLAFHFSNNPNLKTIKDITKLRNQGGNFGSVFDSTQIAPKGSTYGYGPLQNSSGLSELEGAVNEARNSLNRAAAAGQSREYTLYATKANPLVKGRTTRIKDPEYGTSKLAGDAGQSIYGKQKVIASVPLDYKPLIQLEDIERGIGEKASRYRVDPAYEAAQIATAKAKSGMLDQTMNALVQNPKVVRAGLVPSSIENSYSAYAFGTPPVKRASQNVRSVTQIIRDATKKAGLLGGATAVVSKNKKDTKKK